MNEKSFLLLFSSCFYGVFDLGWWWADRRAADVALKREASGRRRGESE
jgi:hypothetical protein